MTRVVHSRADFDAVRRELGGPLGLVATMGALHAGHVALLSAARGSCASVVATIFVNPLQFGPGEDLASYPRSLDEDVALCRQAGADVVWAPSVSDVYPAGAARVRVDPGTLGAELEGVSRPTHFAGVLTAVAKFFGLVRPRVAFFGEKDYQQLILVRQMVTDLEFGVAVRAVPTVREHDGLALSSRNVRLSAEARARALVLSRALFAGRDAAGDAAAVLGAASAVLGTEPTLDVDYLALRDEQLGRPAGHGPGRLLIAARVGGVRLIDNVEVAL